MFAFVIVFVFVFVCGGRCVVLSCYGGYQGGSSARLPCASKGVAATAGCAGVIVSVGSAHQQDGRAVGDNERDGRQRQDGRKRCVCVCGIVGL